MMTWSDPGDLPGDLLATFLSDQINLLKINEINAKRWLFRVLEPPF